MLGVSAGASLGVALVVLTSGAVGGALLAGLGLAGDLALTLAAGAGAALSMTLVLLVAMRVQQGVTLLILGLMFGYFVGAIVSLLLYFALPERIQAYLNWTFGTFSGVTTGQLPLLAGFVLAGLLLSALLVKPLNALLLGETYARSLGVNLKRARIGIIMTTATLVSAGDCLLRPNRLYWHRRAASQPRALCQFGSSLAAARLHAHRRLHDALRSHHRRIAGQ